MASVEEAIQFLKDQTSIKVSGINLDTQVAMAVRAAAQRLELQELDLTSKQAAMIYDWKDFGGRVKVTTEGAEEISLSGLEIRGQKETEDGGIEIDYKREWALKTASGKVFDARTLADENSGNHRFTQINAVTAPHLFNKAEGPEFRSLGYLHHAHLHVEGFEDEAFNENIVEGLKGEKSFERMANTSRDRTAVALYDAAISATGPGQSGVLSSGVFSGFSWAT